MLIVANYLKGKRFSKNNVESSLKFNYFCTFFVLITLNVRMSS